jgi:hypothetical protein
MGQAQATKLYRTFVKGLITEAGPLTFPEDSSVAESNTVLSRKGNRRRRLGIARQSENGFTTTFNNTQQVNEFVWDAPANNANKAMLVTQIGKTLHFFDLTQTDLALGKKSFTVDLSPYVAPTKTAADIETAVVAMAAGKGYLFAVSEATEPVIVVYDDELDQISVKAVVIQMRDFDGVDDGLAPDEEPATLSAAHSYNLHNQGWGQFSGNTRSYYDPFKGQYVTYTIPSGGTNPITAYFSEFARYPGNNKQWWIAKASVADPDNSIELGDFLPDVLNKFTSGNARAPRGHFILNAFNKDRSFASGISGIAPEVITDRPAAVAFYAGRAWYGCRSTIYFSQVLTDKSKAGQCFQEADPTSEDISDLVATDGGVIPIPEASKIIGILPSSNGLLVFSVNGIWFISGTDGGFSADDYAVKKVTPVGTPNSRAFVATKDYVFWWSDEGIIAMQQNTSAFGAIPGDYTNNNLTQNTIQTLYNDISFEAKQSVKAVFDYRNNKIYWLYKKNEELGVTEYDSALIFDLSLGAFTTWTFTQETDDPVLVAFFVVPALMGTVGSLAFDGDERLSPIRYLAHNGNDFLFAEVSSLSFADWGDNPYTSFVEAGYELLEDAARKKSTPTIVVHMGSTGMNESCKFQVKWDWSTSSAANRWSVPFETYRYSRWNAIDSEFNSGYNTIVTKNRVRGSGRSMVFRFSSNVVGADFDVLGWQPKYLGNVNV